MVAGGTYRTKPHTPILWINSEGQVMGVWSSWFLLLRSYFLMRHHFNRNFWNLQNRQLLLQESTGNFCRIFRRFIFRKIISKSEKTRFKNLLNSICRRPHDRVRRKIAWLKGSTERNLKDFLQNFPPAPKINFPVGKFRFIYKYQNTLFETLMKRNLTENDLIDKFYWEELFQNFPPIP